MAEKLHNMSMADLRRELTDRKLAPHGRREELEERLRGALAAVEQDRGQSMTSLLLQQPEQERGPHH